MRKTFIVFLSSRELLLFEGADALRVRRLAIADGYIWEEAVGPRNVLRMVLQSQYDSPLQLQNLQPEPRIPNTIDLVDNNAVRVDSGCNISRLLICFPVKTTNKRREMCR
jgi:hypothetical protein